MIASIKLLVATLGVSQFSGVLGARGQMKKEREQLRRNLRSGSKIDEALIDESERKMQFVFASEDESGTGTGYDDFFAIPEAVEDMGDSAVNDDYFKQRNDPMGNGVGAATSVGATGGSTGSAGVVGLPKDQKSMKVRADIASNSKMDKAAKVGKMMWDETPVMVKGAKTQKAMDTNAAPMKGAKGRLAPKNAKTDGVLAPKNAKTAKAEYYGPVTGIPATKNAKTAKTGYYSPVTDYYGSNAGTNSRTSAEATSAGGGILSGFTDAGTLEYADLFQEPGAEVHRNDDYFNPVPAMEGRHDTPNSGSSGATSNVQQVSGRSSYTFEDDYFNEDERLVFLPRPVVTLASSVFSVNPQTIMSPIVPDGTGDTMSLGTEYLFNQVMTDAQNVNSRLVPVEVDDAQVRFIIALDGVCDRIGPADQNSVQGYCFFTYTFIDPTTQLTSGAFTAQGIIINADVPGQLTVSGGTGVMTGATGLVEILPAALDMAINPPMLVQPPVGADPFNGVAGWAHFFEFDVDVLFFLPELYGR